MMGAEERQLANAIRHATRYVEQFEKHVDRARGKVIDVPHEGREAMSRVKDLKKAHPDHPEVEGLFERVRNALKASKGEGMRITPEMLAYRDVESQLVAASRQLAGEEWQGFRQRWMDDPQAMEAPYPAPDPDMTLDEEVRGKRVILEGCRYPEAQFDELGRSWLRVGDDRRGNYFVDLSSRGWATAYHALQQFQRTISGDTPLPWTIAGELEGGTILAARPGGEAGGGGAVGGAHSGWIVKPVAIYVPDRVLALAAGEGAVEGRFAGAEALAAKKEGLFTVTEVAAGAAPGEVVEVAFMAAKEKNWDLFARCMHPAWFVTDRAEARLKRRWDIQQRVLRELFVHLEIQEEVETFVISGEKIEDDEDFFLSDEDQAEITERADPLVEGARVWTKRFNERGLQEGPPKPVDLRREEGGEWLIYEGVPF